MCPTYLIGPWKNSLVLLNSKGRVYTQLLSERFYFTLINFDFISREINLSSRMTGVNSLFPSVPLWLLSTTWRVMRSEYWKECLITCLQAKWVWGWQNGIKSDSTDEQCMSNAWFVVHCTRYCSLLKKRGRFVRLAATIMPFTIVLRISY